jgi:ADP-ribose pyrophosphatase YjhB (NUDIX family)
MEPRQVFATYDHAAKNTTGGFTYCPICAAELTPVKYGELMRPTCPQCGYIQHRNPGPGVVVLIVEGDRILLGRRAGGFGAGLWNLPQGYIEYEEDYLTAARRETREETGLEIAVLSILSVISNFLAPGLHTLSITVLARVTGGDPRPGDDVDALRWVPLAGPLPEMAFEADTHIIQRYAATRLAGAPVDPRFAAPSGTPD